MVEADTKPQTVEAAFAELTRLYEHEGYHDDSGCDPWEGYWADARQAARALALAVLEEAERRGLDYCLNPPSIYCGDEEAGRTPCAFHALRQRIEALT